MTITFEGGETSIDGDTVGVIVDALANYPTLAAQIQAAMDSLNQVVTL